MSIEAESGDGLPITVSCATCRWYWPKDGEPWGQCRFHPPTMCLDGKTRRGTTQKGDLCSKHPAIAGRLAPRAVEAGPRSMGDGAPVDRETARRADAYDRWCRVIEAEEGSAAVQERVREAILAGKRPWLDA